MNPIYSMRPEDCKRLAMKDEPWYYRATFVDSKSFKFWEAYGCGDGEIRVRYGRIKAEGTVLVKRYKYFVDNVAKKLKKGYETELGTLLPTEAIHWATVDVAEYYTAYREDLERKRRAAEAETAAEALDILTEKKEAPKRKKKAPPKVEAPKVEVPKKLTLKELAAKRASSSAW